MKVYEMQQCQRISDESNFSTLSMARIKSTGDVQQYELYLYHRIDPPQNLISAENNHTSSFNM